MKGMPTTQPAESGELWNSGGTLKMFLKEVYVSNRNNRLSTYLAW